MHISVEGISVMWGSYWVELFGRSIRQAQDLHHLWFLGLLLGIPGLAHTAEKVLLHRFSPWEEEEFSGITSLRIYTFLSNFLAVQLEDIRMGGVAFLEFQIGPWLISPFVARWIKGVIIIKGNKPVILFLKEREEEIHPSYFFYLFQGALCSQEFSEF